MVGFEFVEGVLDFPTLGVREGQLFCRCIGGVEDRGQRPVLLGVLPPVVEGVVDYAHREWCSLLPIPSGGGDDLCQPGSVVEGLEVSR